MQLTSQILLVAISIWITFASSQALPLDRSRVLAHYSSSSSRLQHIHSLDRAGVYRFPVSHTKQMEAIRDLMISAIRKKLRLGSRKRLFHAIEPKLVKRTNAMYPPMASSVRQDVERRSANNETIFISNEGPESGLVNNCKVDMAYSFDDGPYIWHQEMADVFAAHKAKYTSFVNGKNWGCIYDEANVQALRRDFSQGHLIGSHTWSHAHMNTLSHEMLDQEIEKLEEALWKILGIVPAILRPPYGECNDDCVRYLNQRHGLTVVTWDVDSGDSVGATPEQCQDTLRKMPFPGPHMPLSHETYQHSATDIPNRLLPIFKEREYEMMTISGCLGIAPYKILGLPQERDDTWTCS